MNLSLIDLKDEEIVQALTAKYEYHRGQSERYRAMLVAYGLDLNNNRVEQPDVKLQVPIKEPVTNVNILQQINNLKKQASPTFLDSVISILRRGNRPMTVNELNSEYIKVVGKFMPRNNFSSKISNRAAGSGKIKFESFQELPIDRRYWWGLENWFDGDKLKDEYRGKIGALTTTATNLFKQKPADSNQPVQNN